MPVVHRGSNWTINIYADDHGVPHFHVRTPDGEAVVAITTLTILAGAVSPRTMTDVQTWAADHKDLLLARWQELNG